MFISALASVISTRDSVLPKKGHSKAIARSSSPWCGSAAVMASPTPNQLARMWRVCVQAKIHGMARSEPTPANEMQFFVVLCKQFRIVMTQQGV